MDSCPSLPSRPCFLRHGINLSEPIFPAEKQYKAIVISSASLDKMVCLSGEDKLNFKLEASTVLQ